LNEEKLDALVASTPENVSYLCDIPQVPGVVSEAEVHGIAFRETGTEPALVIPAVALDQWAQSNSCIKDVKIYGEFYYYKSDPLNYNGLSRAERKIVDVYFGQPRAREIVAAVVDVFRERGLVKGRVGFDERNVPTSQIRLIQRKLPKVKFVPATDIFEQIRMVKSGDEIARIRKAVEVTEEAIQAVMEASKPGVKNSELQFIYRTTVMRQGCTPFFGVIGAGTEGALVNHLPSEHVLQKGDVMRIDCNAAYKNYVSDVGRNAVLGIPTDKVQKYFNALRKGTEEMEHLIRPGVKFSELFKVAVSTVRKSGIEFYQRQNTGHSLGLQVVEPPLIASKSSARLLEDMVIAIETPYYELGFGAFNPEDTLRVTKNGVEKLSKMENKLYVL
jgi:Xaa-Pro dipeptidase